MKVISLLNEKGGVGKTTLATHIAAGLAVNGHRVVLVDSDAQGHAAVAFGLEPEPRFYGLMVRNEPIKGALRIIPPEIYEPPNKQARGLLAIIPGNNETAFIVNAIQDMAALRNRIAELEDVADIVIFDTSPTASLLHGAIYLTTDGIIYPTELAALSFHSLMESMEHRTSFAQLKRNYGFGEINVMGIVPTKCQLRTVEHSENLEMLRQQFGDLVWTPMSLSITVQEAAMQKRTLFSYAPDSPATKQMWRMVAQAAAAVERLKV